MGGQIHQINQKEPQEMTFEQKQELVEVRNDLSILLDKLEMVLNDVLGQCDCQ